MGNLDNANNSNKYELYKSDDKGLTWSFINYDEVYIENGVMLKKLYSSKIDYSQYLGYESNTNCVYYCNKYSIVRISCLEKAIENSN